MIIGILKEIDKNEKRVVLKPEDVEKIVKKGHKVYIETKAGRGVNFLDEDYKKVGAQIKSKKEIFSKSDMILKLICPTDDEFKKIHNKILFSMLHSKQNLKRIGFIKENNITAIEMESIKNEGMERYIDATDITGEAGVLYALQLLGKIPSEVNVLMLGYGRVGSGAINMCNKLNMKIKILKKSEYKYLEYFMKGKDLLINSITWPEEERNSKNYVIKRGMLKYLNKGAVILDLSVDYPNPIETCKPTSLSKPWFVVDGIKHLSIYGYPGLVPISSVDRYSKQILPLVLEIANNKGVEGLEKKGVIGEAISRAVISFK